MQYHPFPDMTAFIKRLLNATFPLPHGVSPIPFPLCTSFEGTHGTAPRGDTLGTRIDKYSSLVMPLVRQRKEQHSLAHLYCTHKASTHKRQANDSAIYKMKAQSFVWRKKGAPRQKASNWHKWQLWLKALCVTQAWRSIRSAPCASTLRISTCR